MIDITMKNYTDIFFDLDRTLWDFDTNSNETFSDIFDKYKLFNHFGYLDSFLKTYRTINEILWQDYRDNKISKKDLSWQRFHKTLNCVGYDNEDIAKQIAEDYIILSPQKTRLYPGTIELLEKIKNDYRLYIITNGFKEVQYKKLDNCNLTKYFKAIYVSEELGFNKPHKEFFDLVFKDSQASKETSLIIGDDPEIDILGAINSGVDSVWINHNGADCSIPATFTINSLDQLFKILQVKTG